MSIDENISDIENEALDNDDAALEEKYADELAKLEVEKPKRGRPRKIKEEAESDNEESQPDDDEEEHQEDEENPVVETPETVSSAPKSWAKDKHDLWGKIPKEAQDFLNLREKQMLDGLDEYKEGHNYAKYIFQGVEPFLEDIKLAGVDQATAIHNLFSHHRALTTGSQEDRQKALIKIGIDTGIIPPDQVDWYNPQVEQMKRELESLKNMQKTQEQSQYDMRYQDALQKINDFKSKNEHFDIVQQEVAALMHGGLTLEDAYNKAVWANETTRAIELAKINQVNGKQVNMERSIKAASVNVNSSSSQRISTKPKFKNAEEAHRWEVEQYYNKS
jgi:hypothetical protein